MRDNSLTLKGIITVHTFWKTDETFCYRMKERQKTGRFHRFVVNSSGSIIIIVAIYSLVRGEK